MLTENQKQELENKIREAVPESKHPIKWYCEDCESYSFTEKIGKDIRCGACCYPLKRIEGRSLNLQDVLIAMTAGEPDSEDDGIKLEHNIISLVRGHMGSRGYDLTKDFHQQSEEFYDFLYSLLV